MNTIDKEIAETSHRWNIPISWYWVTLADVGNVITGNTPSTKDLMNYGNAIPFVKPPELLDKGIRSAPEGLSEKGLKTARSLPIGAVLVSCIGGLGKTGISKVPIAFNQQINAIVFNENVIPEYGFYYLQTLKEWLHSVASATTLPIVNKGKFQRAPIPIAPYNEQKRIVAEIEKQFSRLDEAVAALKRIQANLKRYKASVLKAAVEGKLTEQWRKEHPDVEPASELLKRILAERRQKWEEDYVKKIEAAHGHTPKDDSWKKKYKEPTPLDTSNLPILPKGWVWVQLQKVFDVITDGDHQPPPQTNEGIPFLVIGNVRTGKLDFANTRFVSKEYYENILEDRIPRRGDILYTVVGSYGIPVLVDTDKNFCVQRHIAIFKPSQFVDRRFLYHILQSNYVFTQATKCATGTAQKTVPLSGLRAILIPFPSLKEQKNIVEKVESRLSVAEEIEAAIEVNTRRAERLRQSILKKAFEGNLV